MAKTQIRGEQSSDQRHDEQLERFYFMTQEDYLHWTSDIPKNDARTGTIVQTELFSSSYCCDVLGNNFEDYKWCQHLNDPTVRKTKKAEALLI